MCGFAVRRARPICQNQGPPPPGDGCDKSLNWWFTDEVLHPKAPVQARATPDDGATARRLPRHRRREVKAPLAAQKCGADADHQHVVAARNLLRPPGHVVSGGAEIVVAELDARADHARQRDFAADADRIAVQRFVEIEAAAARSSKSPRPARSSHRPECCRRRSLRAPATRRASSGSACRPARSR